MDVSHSIRQVSDGVWRWQCQADGEYRRRSNRITITVCAALCLMLLAFSAMLDAEMMTVTATCCAVVMLIAYFICHVFSKLSGTLMTGYELTDRYVMTGSGRWEVRFSFSTTRRIIISQNFLDLRRRFSSMLVYVPPEDFDQVRAFILSRLPESAEVIESTESG